MTSSSRPRSKKTISRPGQDFVNNAAKERFSSLIQVKFIVDRSLDLPRRGYENSIRTMSNVHLENFWVPRDAFDATIAYEFYANAAFHKDCVTKVRGCNVDFSADAINRCFDLLDTVASMTDEERAPTVSNLQLAETLCVGGRIEWKGRSQNLIVTRCFTLEAKIWSLLVNSSVMPTTHISEITRDRAVIIFCMMRGIKINLGEIISSKICELLLTPNPSKLFYPWLIGALCKPARVETRPSDVITQIKNNITHSIITKRIAAREVERLPPPPQAPAASDFSFDPYAARPGMPIYHSLENAYYRNLEHQLQEERYQAHLRNEQISWQHDHKPWDQYSIVQDDHLFYEHRYGRDPTGAPWEYPPRDWHPNLWQQGGYGGASGAGASGVGGGNEEEEEEEEEEDDDDEQPDDGDEE